MAKKEKTINADEFRAEREKLEKDRSMLNERLQALNAERHGPGPDEER